MIIVLGATGHIGSAVADALLARGEAVTVVTRSEAKAERWRSRGADAAVVDIADTDALRAVFWRGRRAFLLNPPAAPSTDTDAEELRTGKAIVAALDGSGLEKAVALSTYGAQAGGAIGDLGTLHAFETALRRQPIPVSILRAAYLMSNWDAMVGAARQGTLPSLFPADFVLPMVAPADVGEAAARHLCEPVDRTAMGSVEGPARHTPGDVARAFASTLGRPVTVAVTPRDRLREAFLGLGFCERAATSYAGMMAANLDGRVELPDNPERGPTTLEGYVEGLVGVRGDRTGG